MLLFIFYGDLYFCVDYSNAKYQDLILELIIKSNSQKNMARSNFECEFHDLNHFDLDFFFVFLEFIIHKVIIKLFVENHQFNVILL